MEEEETSNPCNCCWTFIIICGISTLLIKWDISAISNWFSDSSSSLPELWTLGMSISLTIAWFTLPILIALLIYQRDRVAKVIGVLLLLCCGPNLLIWNIMGCIINAFEFKDFCIQKSDCSLDPMVITMKIFTWGLLFIVSIVCNWGFFTIILETCKNLRLKNRLKKWRQVQCKGQILIESTCSICLDNFAEGEKVRILKCKHEFHCDCIELWIQGHGTCPICRYLCES